MGITNRLYTFQLDNKGAWYVAMEDDFAPASYVEALCTAMNADYTNVTRLWPDDECEPVQKKIHEFSFKNNGRTVAFRRWDWDSLIRAWVYRHTYNRKAI